MPNYRSNLKVDIEPKKILFTSEPYVIYTPFGYQAVADILELKLRHEYILYLSARSLARQLEVLRNEHSGQLKGLEVWIRKKSDDKKSEYIVED